jgi:hypothetical protein
MGYTLNGSLCNVNDNSTMKPCASGYFKDIAGDFKCKPCKGGCKSCTTTANCFQCQDGVKWAATENDVCSFDCDTTCVDGQNGVFKCATPEQGEDVTPPAACALGYQYNGFSLRCERSNPSAICDPSKAPVQNKMWYLSGSKCQQCELPPNSNCLQCDVMKDSCYMCMKNFKL